jgi:hypothetical protein
MRAAERDVVRPCRPAGARRTAVVVEDPVRAALAVVRDSMAGPKPRGPGADRARIVCARDARTFAHVDDGLIVSVILLELPSSDAGFVAVLAPVHAHHDLGHIARNPRVRFDVVAERADLKRPAAGGPAVAAEIPGDNTTNSFAAERAACAVALHIEGGRVGAARAAQRVRPLLVVVGNGAAGLGDSVRAGGTRVACALPRNHWMNCFRTAEVSVV